MGVAIALSAAAGLLLQSGVLRGRFRREMFCYYTNLSNLAVGLYALLRTLAPAESALGRWLRGEVVWFSFSAGIWLTFVIYQFLLYPDVRRKKGREARRAWWEPGNLLVHIITPWLMALDWLLFAGKEGLNGQNALAWLLFPALYLIFAFVRAPLFGPIKEGGSRYPYHFMDPDRLGWGRVIINLVFLLLLCVGATEGIVLFLRI